MTNKELKRLSRAELLELLVAQSKEIDKLNGLLAKASEELEKKQIAIDEAGSIAVASLKLNGVFESAQQAADLYLTNAKEKAEKTTQNCERLERDTRRKCEQMITKARTNGQRYLDEINSKLSILSLENDDLRMLLSTIKPPRL